MGILCNQASFDFTEGKYLFQLLKPLTEEIKLFIPEHGLFAEQQDQVTIEDLSLYKSFDNTVDYISLYTSEDNRMGDLNIQLAGLDTLIIDIQDVGVRYYTYITTIGKIFKFLAKTGRELSVIIIDRRNPAGSQVEGTVLDENFSSMIGLAGIPHRYGLTIGELSLYLKSQNKGRFNIEIIKADSGSFTINPSPNIPGRQTCQVFSGQCLLEGTSLSEGRGTTRPFEIFGAPFLKDLSGDWNDRFNRENPEAVLRQLLFIPSFHKYRDEICYGSQLHPGERYHSLLYTLKMLRSLNQHSPGFCWPEGPYEAGSDKSAIELLAGDIDILQYLKGDGNDREIIEKMREEESRWIKLSRPFLLYPEPLFSVL